MLEHTRGSVKIAYDREGSGPLVIFLHGVGGNRGIWRDQVVEFRKRYCAVAWDARGYGASDNPDQPLEFHHFGDDLCRLLDHLRADKAHLVGLSMGGMILQDFYVRYTGRVATLTLADTTAGIGPADENLRQELLDRRLKPLEQGKTISDLMPQMIEVLTGPHSPATTVDRLTAALLAVRVETYKQALRAISVVNFRSILSTIAVPTLVVVGSDDRLTPPSMSDELASAIPGAERVLIGEAGHVSNLDQPAMFNEVVGDFLNRHSRLASKVTTA